MLERPASREQLLAALTWAPRSYLQLERGLQGLRHRIRLLCFLPNDLERHGVPWRGSWGQRGSVFLTLRVKLW